MIRHLLLLAVLLSPAGAHAQAGQPNPPAAPPPAVPPPAAPPAASAGPAWLPRNTAELVLLDKLRSQPTAVEVHTGQSVTFGALTITLKSCDTRPPDRPQNSAAFLEIVDNRGTVPDFHGWILSNTPAVNQFQHPVYDLRLAVCK